MAVITFDAAVERIQDTDLVRLPGEASAELPSRGQVAVTATVDGRDLDTVVEPDGRRGHWLRLTPELLGSAAVGDRVAVTLAVRSDWPEPEVPDDLAAALDGAPADVQAVWQDITPMARWEWVRWVGATRNPATREKRVAVSISKLDNGKRRPCCFDLSSCTDPELSRSGKLMTGE
ncbi:YdeI/OmpD-associated family protein [Tessaracoccus palaemonis]|uniref:YdeI/OmpD-associated family protein n=1 Tax=Tessaracoccus palaemonis TaxID=2829499 RepID=A0ABX8SJM0_9ACTN|nr:YdeI/OmpD-associated family protein [Tessaracoccus palaemonis]QXT63159.1 YdeI/OmpD-associated family protein [Tessaracoccus palaemonis]